MEKNTRFPPVKPSKVAEYKLLTNLGITPKTVHDSVHETVYDRVQNDQKTEQQPEAQKQDKSDLQVRLIEVTQHWTANALHVRLGSRHAVVKRLRPHLRAIGETYESPLTRVLPRKRLSNTMARLSNKKRPTRRIASEY